MKPSTAFRACIALGLVSGLGLFADPATTAVGRGAVLLRLDDSPPALPLAPSFEKEDGDNGPLGLTLKNTSGNPIKASGVVSLNLGSNAVSKTKEVPEHVIERAETWTIYGLSSGDKVTIVADGFSPLVLTVP
jgi:hypothetical protein